MFSFNDPKFEQFLAEWAEVLMKGETVMSVYYVGTSVWMPSDESRLGFQLIPNFIVRTDDPYWENFDGLLYGRPNHVLVKAIREDIVQRLYSRWHHTGWTPEPLPTRHGFDPIDWTEPHQFIRIIEVPAGLNWAGPEYLSRVPNGISVDYTHQESLRRYSSKTMKLEAAARYVSCDDRLVMN